MKKYHLPNDMEVLLVKRPTSSIVIELCVHAGSNNEELKDYGISHFIEHLLFEGSVKRPNSMLISNEIEKIGGEINAATSNERTFYFIKVAKKYFSVALDVISDIIQNPLFTISSIEKERKIIIDEINMVTDDPRFHQWILFQKALFQKHPAKNPVYGTRATVKTISRQQILDYYNKFYVPSNMTLTIVGGFDNILPEIKESFKTFNKKSILKTSRIIEPKATKPNKIQQIKDIMQSYMVMGYKTPPRAHFDSYILDVIRGHLGRGQSGRLFQEVRVKHGLAYDIGVMHEPSVDYGIFAVYVGTNKQNLNKCSKIIMNELINVANMTDMELNEAKSFVEGEYLLANEDNFKCADSLSFFAISDTPESAFNYIKKINSVTLDDIKKIVYKFFNKNNTTAIIRQK